VARIPPEFVAPLGGLKQMRVLGTVNGVAIRSSTMPYRGGFFLGIHKATREAAGIDFGDALEIEITRDDSPRVLALPSELEEAFTAEHALAERFASLSFSRRRELVEPISEAKRPETRARRLEDALHRLREV
jgi:bifunctional DNA-binding transcriptional regulator/antitoxin component of YhaV-PrlF toxin-antitoxin module